MTAKTSVKRARKSVAKSKSPVTGKGQTPAKSAFGPTAPGLHQDPIALAELGGDPWRILPAHFPSKCVVCQEQIDIGETIVYTWTPAKLSAHTYCTTGEELSSAERELATPYKVLPGRLLFEDEQWLRVVAVARKFIRQGGHSYGLENEGGWVSFCYARPATDEEAAVAEEKLRRRQAREIARLAVTELATLFRREGECVEGWEADGERLLERDGLYGDKSSFVLNGTWITYVKNTGDDGVPTEGLDITWRIPHSDELEEQLRLIADASEGRRLSELLSA